MNIAPAIDLMHLFIGPHQMKITKRIRRIRGTSKRKIMPRNMICKFSIISVELNPKSEKLSLSINSLSSYISARDSISKMT